MKNFEFEHEGQKYWYSRGIVCITYALARDRQGELCILANKRGEGVVATGLWNCPCGHLDFDEDCKDCAVRETFEETSVKIDRNLLQLFTVNSKPDGSKTQPIGFHYYVLLPNFIDEYPLSDAHMEKDEVAEIKWIPISDIEHYDWAFNHLFRIKQILKHLKLYTDEI